VCVCVCVSVREKRGGEKEKRARDGQRDQAFFLIVWHVSRETEAKLAQQVSYAPLVIGISFLISLSSLISRVV